MADNIDDALEPGFRRLQEIFTEDSDDEEFEYFLEEEVLEDMLRNTEYVGQFPMENDPQDRENLQDVQDGWKNVDNEIYNMPFSGSPGLTDAEEIPDVPQAIDFFYYLFNEDFLEVLVQQTNLLSCKNRIKYLAASHVFNQLTAMTDRLQSTF